MSRTYKDKIKKDDIRTTLYGNKMTAYAGKGVMKEYPPMSTGNPHGDGYSGFKLGITKMGKLIARNANRSKNKTTRQKAKEEILKELGI